MVTVRDFLSTHRHWTATAELRRRIVLERLPDLVSERTAPMWIQTLAVFVLDRPWRYWDLPTVVQGLSLLEADPGRAVDALREWKLPLGMGFDALFHESPAALSDEGARMFHVREIARLGTVYHPEYLRFAEHVFGNLLTVFWAAQRKGGVSAKFDLTRAAGELRRAGRASLANGFEDRLRNAFAHGQITFRGTDVRYGPPAGNYSMAPSEFLAAFDELVRTSNALAFAILLFCARNHDLIKYKGVSLPIRPLAFAASAAIDSAFIEFEGAYESELASTGRQMHIGLRTKLLQREFVLLAAATVAYHLIELGGVGLQTVFV